MKEIELTQGKIAWVDDEDYEWLNKWKWCVQNRRGYYYAARGEYNLMKGMTLAISMHREILKVTNSNIVVDHKDRNTLNNQKNNLRKCTRAQNNLNRKHNKDGLTSKYIGVCLRYGKWFAQIRSNNITYPLGYFELEEDAAKAYNEAAIKYHGEFAVLNDLCIMN